MAGQAEAVPAFQSASLAAPSQCVPASVRSDAIPFQEAISQSPRLQIPRNSCTIPPDFYQQAPTPMTFARFHFYFYFSYPSPKAEEKR